MQNKNQPKVALDTIIRKSRVHFYKPIQIAEILYSSRMDKKFNLKDLESYRNVSKKWRDIISTRLVGRICTSSQKFQDNIFEQNAMPVNLLVSLGEMNKQGGGFVEAYIYKSMQKRLSSVYEVWEYIKGSAAESFSVKELVNLFVKSPGLKRSIDKTYEICVYALFTTIVRALRAQITLEIKNKDAAILQDFDEFIKAVLGINAKQTKLVLPAALYRAGVANAADRGLDMWANFGAAIQVKHLSLTPEVAEEIADSITAERIVIVCLDAEKEQIKNILKQVGWGEKIQGIITLNDLDKWYQLCLSKKYKNKLGGTLLKDLLREFEAEFPSSEEIVPFLKDRGYDKIGLPKEWQII